MGNSFSPDPSKSKFAILNADDVASQYLSRITAAQVVTYGIRNSANIMAKEIQLTSNGTKFALHSFVGVAEIELVLVDYAHTPDSLNKYETGYIDPTQYNVPSFYELLIVTSEKTWKERETVIAAFWRAAQKGFDDMQQNPDEALDIFLAN